MRASTARLLARELREIALDTLGRAAVLAVVGAVALVVMVALGVVLGACW